MSAILSEDNFPYIIGIGKRFFIIVIKYYLR